ncbi:hypothetical protein O6H91_23G013200 [Diphasiastrum complanatum]|uniref:Uncharacterized protein n=1 Tax=Diphasiastrum complanatum TaxID=34168 RepID=A0ACC2A8B2_DIPCM|nr:hypothetical protein O6H91_23G013200 [Diphasiastrum complanatum]
MWRARATSALRALSSTAVLPPRSARAGLLNPGWRCLDAAAIHHHPYSFSGEQDVGNAAVVDGRLETGISGNGSTRIASEFSGRKQDSSDLDVNNGFNSTLKGSEDEVGEFRATSNNSNNAQTSISSKIEQVRGTEGASDCFAYSASILGVSNGAGKKLETANNGFAGSRSLGIFSGVKNAGSGDNKGSIIDQGGSSQGGLTGADGFLRDKRGADSGFVTPVQMQEASFKQQPDFNENRAPAEKFASNGYLQDQNQAAINWKNFAAPKQINKPTPNQRQPLPANMNARNSTAANRTPVGVRGSESFTFSDQKGRNEVVFGQGPDVVRHESNETMRSKDKLPIGQQGPGNAVRSSADMSATHRFDETPQSPPLQRQVDVERLRGASAYPGQVGNFTKHVDPRRNSVSQYTPGGESRGSGVVKETDNFSGGYTQQSSGGTSEYRSSNEFIGAQGQIQGQDRFYNFNAHQSGLGQPGKAAFAEGRADFDFHDNLGHLGGRDNGGHFEGRGFGDVQDTNLLYEDMRSRRTQPLGLPELGNEIRSSPETRGGHRFDQTQSPFQNGFDQTQSPSQNYADVGHYRGSVTHTSPDFSGYQDLRGNSTHHFLPERENKGFRVIQETDEFSRGYIKEAGWGKIPPEYRGSSGFTNKQGPSYSQDGFHKSTTYPSGFGQRGGSGAPWDGRQNAEFDNSLGPSAGGDKVGYFESRGFGDVEVTNPYVGAGQPGYQPRASTEAGVQKGFPVEGDRYGGSTGSISAKKGYNQFPVQATGLTDVQSAGVSSRAGRRTLDKRSFEDAKGYDFFAARSQSSQHQYSGKVPVISSALPRYPLDDSQSQTSGGSSGIRNQNILNPTGGFTEQERYQGHRHEENISMGQPSSWAKENAKASTTTALPLAHENIHSQYRVESVGNSLGLESNQCHSQSADQHGTEISKFRKMGPDNGFLSPQGQSSHVGDLSSVNPDKDKTLQSNTIGTSPQSPLLTNLVLEREWLFSLGPSLHRNYQANTLIFQRNGREIQLQGEHDVPNSPMVCSSELCQLIGDSDHQEPCMHGCKIFPNLL